MDYFFLWCMPDDADLRNIEGGDLGNGFRSSEIDEGKALAREPTGPARIKIRPGSGDMPEMFMAPLVMSETLVHALQGAGVDNMDVYDAVLEDPETGETREDYRLINLIGIVDLIDHQKSALNPSSPPEIAMIFDEIVFDPSKARGLHMFRLMHMSSHVIVADSVRTHLEGTKLFPNLEFIEAEDYA